MLRRPLESTLVAVIGVEDPGDRCEGGDTVRQYAAEQGAEVATVRHPRCEYPVGVDTQIGFDLVELAPARDLNGLASLTAGRIICYLCGILS